MDRPVTSQTIMLLCSIIQIDEDGEAVYYIHASYHGLVAMVPSNNTGIFYYHFDARG